MTIRRGEEWGIAVARPVDLRIAPDDAALALMVASDAARPVGLSGGDLFRSVGSPAPRDPVQRLPIDAIQVSIDDREPVLAVAHVVARRYWWRGAIIAVMNADHVGDWNVAPRAHPNDGKLDVVEVAASMSLRHRWQARARLPQGTHVPHPAITVRTVAEADWTFATPTPVTIDGVSAGRARRLVVSVLPDHFAIDV